MLFNSGKKKVGAKIIAPIICPTAIINSKYKNASPIEILKLLGVGLY